VCQSKRFPVSLKFRQTQQKGSIDLLPNERAETSTGSEVLTPRSEKSQKRQTAHKEQRQKEEKNMEDTKKAATKKM
jgi:hypothetical protein